MAKHEKTVDGRKFILFSKVTKSRRNNGGPPGILVQFSKNGTPWHKGGPPRKGETVENATFRYFNELRIFILGGQGSEGLAAEARWPKKAYWDIELFFDEFNTILISQPVEA